MRNPLLPDKLSRRRGEAAWTDGRAMVGRATRCVVNPEIRFGPMAQTGSI
jgi:hypothetical protein